jgi:hypothetical protein
MYSSNSRTYWLRSAKVRYVKSRLTGKAAAGKASNVADIASLPYSPRSARTPNAPDAAEIAASDRLRTNVKRSKAVAVPSCDGTVL